MHADPVPCMTAQFQSISFFFLSLFENTLQGPSSRPLLDVLTSMQQGSMDEFIFILFQTLMTMLCMQSTN